MFQHILESIICFSLSCPCVYKYGKSVFAGRTIIVTSEMHKDITFLGILSYLFAYVSETWFSSRFRPFFKLSSAITSHIGPIQFVLAILNKPDLLSCGHRNWCRLVAKRTEL